MSTPNQVAADLTGMIAAARIAAHKTVVTFGARLQASVKRNASGRPGPNAPTGDYRRSINRRTTMRATVSVAEVGSGRVQARRLELGFVGTDALGRSYDQPPYPHFGPALTEITPLFEAALAAIAWPKR